MHDSRKILNLTSFLYASFPPLDHVARFLALETFSAYSPTSLVLGLLESDGSISVVGSFGLNQIARNRTLHHVSSSENPLRQSIIKDEIIEIEGAENFTVDSPKKENLDNLDGGSDCSIIWPIYYIGAGILHCKRKISLAPIDELFFRAVGGILALNNTCLTLLSESDRRDEVSSIVSRDPPARSKSLKQSKSSWSQNDRTESESDAEAHELTPRQEVILAALSRGQTNSTIAEDLNYSESLIRQETIEIYRKMGISGRRDLLKEAKFG